MQFPTIRQALALAALACSGTIPTTIAEGYKNIVYFIEWGIYARNFPMYNVDWSRITHINYAFGKPNADGKVGLFDSWSAIEKRYPEWGDSWDITDGAFGQFGLANKLKRKYRNTKFGLSIGGWTLSDKFSDIVSTAQGRQTFVKSSVKLMLDLGLDFIDLDWEYPVEGGNDSPPVPHRPDDIKNFVLLLKEFRSGYENLPFKAELSVASPAGPANYRHWDMPAICGLLDSVNIMTYDFAGSWSSYTDHSSNLYLDPNHPAGDKFSVHSAVQDYIKMGCPSNKIVLGIPLYGHSFENTNGLYSNYTKPREGSWLPGGEGNYDYKALPLPGGTEMFDSTTVAAYSYNPTTKKFVSYESPQSMKYKLEYVKKYNLGGTMFWEASGDAAAGSDRSLITQAYNFYGSSNMAFSQNSIDYPTSKYSNIRNGSSTNPTPAPKPTTVAPTPTTVAPTPSSGAPTPSSNAPSTSAPAPRTSTPSPNPGGDCGCNQGNCASGKCNNCNYVSGEIRACYAGWSKDQCQGTAFNWCG